MQLVPWLLQGWALLRLVVAFVLGSLLLPPSPQCCCPRLGEAHQGVQSLPLPKPGLALPRDAVASSGPGQPPTLGAMPMAQSRREGWHLARRRPWAPRGAARNPAWVSVASLVLWSLRAARPAGRAWGSARRP